MNSNSDVPLLQRVFSLQPMGDGDELRTLNEHPEDWERDNVVERTDGGINVFGDLMEVRHGTLGSKEDAELASLMVFRFRFDADEGRRILRTTLSIEFFGNNPLDRPIELFAIAPFERWSILPTVDQENIITGGRFAAGASGVPFLNLDGTIRLEKSITRKITSSTTISGVTELATGSNSGPRTRAVWKLRENEKRKTGIPDSVTVAVLLTRKSDDPFKAVVEIDSHADPLTGFGRLFRRVPMDDPVLFNPSTMNERRVMGLVREIGAENLRDKDLYQFVKTRMTVDAFWTEDYD